MRVLAAHVENHEGWSLADILVQEDESKALVQMEHEWEDRDGNTTVLWSDPGFVEGTDLVDRIYTADGYDELVNSRFKLID